MSCSLEGSNNLRGFLNIYGLSDVANTEEANKAKLYEKSYIQCLLLSWRNKEERGDIEYNDDGEREGLKPYLYLKQLNVKSFEFSDQIISWCNSWKLEL